MPIAEAVPQEQAREHHFCDTCGDEVAVVIGGNGPCCHNLPNPWHRGSDGLYNQPSTEDFEREDHEAEPEPEDEEPSYAVCPECGRMCWEVTGTQRIEDPENCEGETVYYNPSDFEVSLSCANCEHKPRWLNLESY